MWSSASDSEGEQEIVTNLVFGLYLYGLSWKFTQLQLVTAYYLHQFCSEGEQKCSMWWKEKETKSPALSPRQCCRICRRWEYNCDQVWSLIWYLVIVLNGLAGKFTKLH